MVKIDIEMCSKIIHGIINEHKIIQVISNAYHFIPIQVIFEVSHTECWLLQQNEVNLFKFQQLD